MSCLRLTIEYDTFGEQISTQSPAGTYSSYDYWIFNYGGEDLYIWYSAGRWFGSKVLGDLATLRVVHQSTDTCPAASLGPTISTDWVDQLVWTNLVTFTTECVPCPEPNCDQEDRHEAEYKSIKLPSDFVEDDRGIKGCCCKYLVLANLGEETWKNDITSAWIKTSDPNDRLE
jgi:hypothetical protein